MIWQDCRLGDVMTLQRGHDLPSALRHDGSIPVVSSSGITGYHNISKAQAPGVVTGRYGTLGQVFYLKEDYWPLNTALYVVDFKGTNPRFAAYFLENVLRDYRSDKAAVPGIDRKVLHDVRVRVPTDPAYQESIAGVLAAYEELIENNNRRVVLLTDAAHQLYREWFVRFHFPGHEHVRVVGDVPEGWSQVPLGDIIDVIHGFAFQGEYFSDTASSRILTTPGNFKIGGGIKVDKLKFYNDEGPLDVKYALSPMDLVLTMTDLSQMGDTLGFPAFIPTLDGRRFLHNQRVGKVVPKGEWFPKHLLFCLFCDDRYRHHVVGAATGTSVKHTSPKRVLNYVATLPLRDGLIASFEAFAEPVFGQINFLIATNDKLSSARDLLLPRLMSGEIIV